MKLKNNCCLFEKSYTNGHFSFQKETGAKSVALATTQKMCHSVSFIIHFSDVVTFLICINISRWEKAIREKESAILLDFEKPFK